MMSSASVLRRTISTVLSGVMALGLITFTPISALGAGSGGVTERVSLLSGLPGAQATGGPSSAPAMTLNGRFVAFASDSTNLVASDTNGVTDVFVRDRASGLTERVSVDSLGAAGIGTSGQNRPSISADGNLVVFESNSHLVGSPSFVGRQVYLRNRAAGTTTLISIGANNAAPDFDSYQASISSDGNYVAFTSNASNLVANDTNGAADVFVRNLLTNTTERVSVGGTSGTVSSAQYLGENEQPSISGDGRFVAFRKGPSSSDPLDVYHEIWVRDRTAVVSKRLTSTFLANGKANGNSYNPVISNDGTYVAFDTDATNIKGGQSLGHGVARVKVSDLAYVCVSQANTVDGNGTSEQPSISTDGRYVAFKSAATNLTAGDSGGFDDIFVRDCNAAAPILASVSTAGAQATGSSASPALSGDGQLVAFASSASNLVPSDTNGIDDIIARLVDTAAPVTTVTPPPGANAAGWWTVDVNVAMSSTDVGSGVASTQYTINGGGTQTYSAPVQVTAEGTSTFACFATDKAGNVESPSKLLAVKIDKTKPTLTLDKANGGSFSWPCRVTATKSDALSGIDTTQGVELDIDNTGWTEREFVDLTPGAHTVNARVSDRAGNQQFASTSITVNDAPPDTHAPHTTALVGPGVGKWQSAPTVTFSATDDISGVVGTSYSVDNGSTYVLTSPASTDISHPAVDMSLLMPVDGPHTVRFWSIDGAANTEDTTQTTVYKDSSAPTVTFAPPTSFVGHANVTVTATDLHSGVATGGVMMRVDAGSYRLGSSISVTTPGYHMVYARAVDNAGNSREIAKKIVINNKVSLSAPRISGSATHTRATKFVGTVSPGHSVRVTVTIQRRVSGRWRSYSIDRPTSNSAGAWSFKRKVRAGTFRLRATTSAGVPWLAGASAWRTVKIK